MVAHAPRVARRRRRLSADGQPPRDGVTRESSSVALMASDDWRLRIELEHEEKHGLLGRLGLRESDAEELAAELRDLKLAVTEEDGTLHVYAGSSLDLERARTLIEREFDELGLQAESMTTEHWLAARGALGRRRAVAGLRRRAGLRGLRALGGPDPRARPQGGRRAGRPPRSRGLRRHPALELRDRGLRRRGAGAGTRCTAPRRGGGRRRDGLRVDAAESIQVLRRPGRRLTHIRPGLRLLF